MINERTFTPGPWKCVPCENVTGFKVESAEGRLLALTAYSTETRRGESLYNAQLMTAAPEMIQALRAILNRIYKGDEGHFFTDENGRFNELGGLVLTAIAKARYGE